MTDVLPARVVGEPHREEPPSSSAANAERVAVPDSPSTTSQHSPSTSLRNLPTELIDAILDCVPEHELQRTAAALMRVSPEWVLSESHLFRHLRIERPEQLKPLWAKLRRDKEQVREQQQQRGVDEGPVVGKLASTTRTFTIASWRGDADLMVSILRILPRLLAMHLHVGTNFSPEHLSDAFEIPKTRVRRVELRFRPYVDRASYYQFLKGSYFDSAIDTLVRNWDETPSLKAMSLCQDVPPRFSVPHLARQMGRTSLEDAETTTGATHVEDADEDAKEDESSSASSSGSEDVGADLTDLTPVEPARGYTGHGPFTYLSGDLAHLKPKTFAQPIVFFDIRCLARLASSRAAKHVAHFRLRVPCRDIAAVLCEGANNGVASHGRRFFPSLTLLDLSTTNMRLDGWLPYLVRRYERLEHLILDRTNLFGFQGRDNGGLLCAELGKLIVMAGMARSKDREREITSWDVAERKRQAIADRERRRQQEEQRERDEAERAMQLERDREERRRAGVASDSEEEEEKDSDDGNSSAASSAEQAPAATTTTAFPEHRKASKVTPAMQRARARRAARAIGTANFSIREGTARNRAHDRAREQTEEQVELGPSNLVAHVLPPLPSLRSVNIGGEANRLDDAKANEWEKKFHGGWKDGLERVMEWASTTVQRYERARKAAAQWRQEQSGTAGAASAGSSSSHAKGKGKSVKSSKDASSSLNRVKPPTDVRLYRYPDGPDELAAATAATLENPEDPFVGLFRVDLDSVDHPIGDSWRLPYLEALADAESTTGSRSVVLCCVPDCEGPMRRGEDGDRMDGRSGMTIEDGTVRALLQHRPGCGHAAGRKVWSVDG